MSAVETITFSDLIISTGGSMTLEKILMGQPFFMPMNGLEYVSYEKSARPALSVLAVKCSSVFKIQVGIDGCVS